MRPRCNILGPTALGFRHRDDVVEITRLLDRLGIDVHVTAPLGATPADLARLGDADFNVVLYPETGMAAGAMAAADLRPAADQDHPHRHRRDARLHREVAALAGVDATAVLEAEDSGCPGTPSRSTRPT